MSLTKDSTNNKNLNEDAPPSEDIPEKPVEEPAEGEEIEQRQIQEEPSQTAEEQPETVEESAEEEKQSPPPEPEARPARETERREKKKTGMQGSKLYVGNLSYSVTNEELEELFSNHGEVREINIIEGRGFGFVEMSNPSEAEEAKEALDGSDFGGRTLKIDEARPQRSRQRGEGGRPGGRQRRGPRRY